MLQDCFALSGLTDGTASTPQGVALGWFVPALRAKEPPMLHNFHCSVRTFVRLGSREPSRTNELAEETGNVK
jgi:hypothetical protein